MLLRTHTHPQQTISEIEDAFGFIGQELRGEHCGGQKSDIRGLREGQAERERGRFAKLRRERVAPRSFVHTNFVRSVRQFELDLGQLPGVLADLAQERQPAQVSRVGPSIGRVTSWSHFAKCGPRGARRL